MGPILEEHAFIDVAVCVTSLSCSLHFTIHKLSFVFAQVGPSHYTIAMKLVFKKLPYVYFSCVCKIIFAVPMELSLNEITFVGATLEFEFPFAGFLPIIEISLVLYGVVVPQLYSMAMLQIILPFAIVQTSFIITEHASTICFTVCPLSLINVSICMDHSSISVKHAILCLSLVLRIIREFDNTETSPLYLRS